MRLADLLAQIAEMDSPQHLDESYVGSCPCFLADLDIDGQRLHIDGRCWRVSEHEQDLYVWGELPAEDLERVGAAVKAKLDAQHWYNPYTVTLRAP
jgi:hypothetical protein